MRTFVGLLVLLCSSAPAFAHGGGLNSDGCHNDRKRGTYHCHRSSYTPSSADVTGGALVPSATGRTTTADTASDGFASSLTARTPATSAERASSQSVRSAQILLQALGYNPGTPDGVAGPATRAAIILFQADRALPVTGAVDDALLLNLAQALASDGEAPGS
jgi:hypothetical protein